MMDLPSKNVYAAPTFVMYRAMDVLAAVVLRLTIGQSLKRAILEKKTDGVSIVFIIVLLYT